MTAGPHDPRDASTTGVGSREDDLSIVPGLGPLDMAQDPDRYDPSREVVAPAGRLDPAQDPDRYLPPGQGQTLTELLGEGAHEQPRDGYQWITGLLGVFLFIALVSWFFTSVATP